MPGRHNFDVGLITSCLASNKHANQGNSLIFSIYTNNSHSISSANYTFQSSTACVVKIMNFQYVLYFILRVVQKKFIVFC